jgi:predicted ATPase
MLKRIKIQGYKSLVDVEVHLQPLTVLFGPNASGKSNFLDALQLLSRIVSSKKLNDAFEAPYRGTALESLSFGRGGVQGLLAQEKAAFSIEVDIELSNSIVDLVHQQIKELDDGKKSSYIRERYLRYRIEVEIFPKTGGLHVAKESLVALDASGKPKEERPFLDWDGFYRRLEGQKIVRVDSYPRDTSFLLPYNPVFHPHLVAMREELASWYFYYLEPRERMRLLNSVKEVQHIGLMGEYLAAFLNTLQVADRVQFKALENALHMIVPSINGIDIRVNNYGNVEFELIEGQTPIPASIVSEGTLRVLGLLALSTSKELPSLLGIEEPENGIHPRRIRLITSLLETRARRNTQIIITTHSPVLIDLIPRESLYVCRKSNGHTSIEPYSHWEFPAIDKALDDEENADLPELTVSERMRRGDFDV